MSDKHLNSVVQIICSQGKPAFSKMSAGTGWFARLKDQRGRNVLEKSHIITNAHVINGAHGVFIRLPSLHKQDIQVSVVGVSTDLDIAVLQLSEEGMAEMKSVLRHTKSKIVPFDIGDSDHLIAENFQNMVTLGYPLGTENQMKTYGNYSGLKHAAGLEQLYITSDAAINPGSSGGPLVHADVDGVTRVYGMNTMKVSGAELVSMHIPSNRIVRALPSLVDNRENKEIISNYVALAQAMHSQGGVKSHDLRSFTNHVANALLGIDVDAVQMMTHWKEHALGGHKRTKNGVEQVSFGEWYAKHVMEGKGGHAVMQKVARLMRYGDIDAIHELRKVGFHTERCSDCIANQHNDAPQLNIGKYTIPPTVVHMPRIGVQFSNSIPRATAAHYGVDESIHGVAISTIVTGGMFDNAGLRKDDFVHQLEVNGETHEIDNYGESWFPALNVSLPIVDIIHRSEIGEQVTVHYYREGKEHTKVIKYGFLDDNMAPQIRCLDSLKDMSLAQQMATVDGVVFTPLRLNHVEMFRLSKYMDAREQNQFKIVVADLATGSPAFLSKNIMPGDVLTHMNDTPIADAWTGNVRKVEQAEYDQIKDDVTLLATATSNKKTLYVVQESSGFVDQLQQLKKGDTVKFDTERGVSIVLQV